MRCKAHAAETHTLVLRGAVCIDGARCAAVCNDGHVAGAVVEEERELLGGQQRHFLEGLEVGPVPLVQRRDGHIVGGAKEVRAVKGRELELARVLKLCIFRLSPW